MVPNGCFLNSLALLSLSTNIKKWMEDKWGSSLRMRQTQVTGQKAKKVFPGSEGNALRNFTHQPNMFLLLYTKNTDFVNNLDHLTTAEQINKHKMT